MRRYLSALIFPALLLLVGCGDDATPGGGEPSGKARCGGIQGLSCPAGQAWVDDPTDDCDPAQGGRDCSGFCESESPSTGKACGGIAGLKCPEGELCVDDPSDDCDPEKGGRDCIGVCNQAPAKAEAFFNIGFKDVSDRLFVIKLTDAAEIEAARLAIRDPENNPHSVMGIVVKETADYNPTWRFHLDPGSIDLFQVAVEVCDANPEYVEENLDEVCGATLPDCRWCPWSSQVVSEVTAAK